MTSKASAARLGVYLEEGDAPTLETANDETIALLSETGPAHGRTTQNADADYFVNRDGLHYAGTHLLLDLWGATSLTDANTIERALVAAARAAGATVLHSHMHAFGPDMGVSGVVVLAESHISIHTWPERDYAALDIFMCGNCDPHNAIPVLRKAFAPTSLQLSEQKRGVVVC